MTASGNSSFPLTMIANAGRSGSTYLWNLLKENDVDGYVLHEDIPVQVSQPRIYNRLYRPDEREFALGDTQLTAYLERWKALLRHGPVIETGWTAYHLLPLLHDIFGPQLQIVVLYREPWSVALSRANMGNYHPRTWYDDAHEVSPFDERSIAPEFGAIWNSMNHAEKCLYWWYIVYREIDEFLLHAPDVAREELSAESVFDGTGLKQLRRHSPMRHSAYAKS